MFVWISGRTRAPDNLLGSRALSQCLSVWMYRYRGMHDRQPGEGPRDEHRRPVLEGAARGRSREGDRRRDREGPGRRMESCEGECECCRHRRLHLRRTRSRRRAQVHCPLCQVLYLHLSTTCLLHAQLRATMVAEGRGGVQKGRRIVSKHSETTRRLPEFR